VKNIKLIRRQIFETVG